MSDIEDYVIAKAVLAEAKKEEMRLRKILIAPMIDGKLEGSVTQQFGDYKVTATAKVNRTIDVAVLDAIWEDLDDFGKAAVQFKPSLLLKEYRELEAEGHMLMEAVTVKPGTPGIKVEMVL